MTREDKKNDISVKSRLTGMTDKQLKIIDFIIDYSFKDKKEVYTNGAILVPLFRVLDAIAQNGEQYQECFRKSNEIIIPKEEPKQICEYCKIEISKYGCACGEKPKQERMYSEEDMNKYADYVLMCSAEKTFKLPLQPKEWFEQFKKK